ncbi:hypothetical protein VKT23_014661 [Stygiomarasmius scandens]|uniref:Uncharacterized protein n=1 Tax=Marasmiellus scandens TaxID=2682957 RepID=A0ABR1J038_9AGAR
MWSNLLSRFSLQKNSSSRSESNSEASPLAEGSQGTSRTRPIIPIPVLSRSPLPMLPTIPEDGVLRTPFQPIPTSSTTTFSYPTPATSVLSPIEVRSRALSLGPATFLQTPFTPVPRLNENDTMATPDEPRPDRWTEQLHHLHEQYLNFQIRASLTHSTLPTVELQCPHCKDFIRTGIAAPFDWPNHGCLSSQYFNQLLSHIQSCSAALNDSDNESDEDRLPVRSSSAPPNLTRVDSPMLVSSDDLDVLKWCAGVRIPWSSSGGLFRTFPWARLAESGAVNLPVYIEIKDKGKTLIAWSKKCTGDGDLTVCAECNDLPELFEHIESVARRAAPGTNYAYLGIDTLILLLHERYNELQAWKLKTLNLRCDLVLSLHRLDDHERLLEALSERNVPRVHQLLAQARRQGMSIPAIISRLRLAFDGLYSPKGFVTDDFYLAVMVLCIGGEHLLKILSEELGLPSLRLLHHKLLFIKVHPTVGRIAMPVVTRNIDSVFLRARLNAICSVGVPKRGAQIMIDEIALNEQAVYLKSENSIGGLCWLHTHADELKLDSFTKVTKVAKSVAKGDIHLGKEMTVAVIGVFGETSVYPILVAATCKRETAADSEFTFCTVSEAYFAHPDASQIPLWCWYTDGDPKCRPGGHQYFVTVTLPHDSRLYHLLKDLLSLNLFTGPMTITIGFDWHHIDKRFSTCIRSTAGITINSGHCIDRIMLLRWLQRIPNMSLCQAQRLLYPRDAQSVPRALKLFQAIIKLANLDIELANPGEEQDFDSIRMLAELLSSLLDPFVKTAWTLSQAVTSLSKFAHLLCAQFRAHRLQFCSNQLYYDSQSMVKNIIFNIAKQQILDDSQPFRIAKDGDNEEEKYFGILRVLGGHCPGMNLKEGLSRMGSAADINRVHEEHPTWEPGQHRLEATTAEGMDKVNAKTKWDADIIAGNCDLEECWMEGRDQAVKALKSSFFPMDARYYDFETLFADCKADLLRPFGDNVYPGIATDTSHEEDEEDRSMVQEPQPSDMAFEPGVDDPPSTTL